MKLELTDVNLFVIYFLKISIVVEIMVNIFYMFQSDLIVKNAIQYS